MSMMNGPVTGAMMLGGGLFLLLAVAALVLSMIALAKYFRGAR